MTPVLWKVLQAALGPQKYDAEIPHYNPFRGSPATAPENIGSALKQIYLFVVDDPRRSGGLSKERQTTILIQILEALDPDEANLFIRILNKDLMVKGLNKKLVNLAFPKLIL